MAVTFTRSTGVVVMTAGSDTITFDKPTFITDLLVRSTTAGAFVIAIDNASITVNNAANGLMETVKLNRRVTTLTLTSGPTGLMLTAFLKKN